MFRDIKFWQAYKSERWKAFLYTFELQHHRSVHSVYLQFSCGLCNLLSWHKDSIKKQEMFVEPGSVGMCQSSNPNSSVAIIPQFHANSYSMISMYTFAKNVQI